MMHVAGEYGYFLCGEHKVTDPEPCDTGKQIYPCEHSDCGKPGHAYWYHKEQSLTTKKG